MTYFKGTKTTEVTRLQIGDAVDEAKLVVSTIAEAEHLTDYLHELSANGKSCNVRNQVSTCKNTFQS